MKFFAYNKTACERSSKETIEIFNAVRNLSGYAMSIYKSRWEDALDVAFFHIMKNYDSEKGELENYAIKVVRGIGLNYFKKECPSDIVVELSDINANSKVNSLSESLEDALYERENLESCTQSLIPYFIKDFRFFDTMDSSKRGEVYSDIFNHYSISIIKQAVEYLKEDYSDSLREIYKLRKSCAGRKAGKDKIEKSRDNSIVVTTQMNNTVFYKKTTKSEIKKHFYKVDVKDLIGFLLKKFYMSGKASILVEGTRVYCTLSGGLVFSLEDLVESLEKDSLASLIIRSKLRVAKYKKGQELLLVGNKEIEGDIGIKIFDEEAHVHLIAVPSKEVKKVKEGVVEC